MSGLTHLVFDIETLGLRENTVVTTLACVPFRFEEPKPFAELTRDGFYVKFDVKEQIQKYRRTTDQSTLDFWKKQPKEARAMSIEPSAHDVQMAVGLEMLRDWIKTTPYTWNESYVWSRGTYFDFPKIESMYANISAPCPFNTWRIRDIRTMIDCLTGATNGQYNLRDGVPNGFVKHNALHDAALDATVMTEIFQSLL